MNKTVTLNNFEKIILRMFAAWCIATVYVWAPVKKELYDINSIGNISLKNLILYMIFNFLIMTAVDIVAEKSKKMSKLNTDVIFYILSIMFFGINAVYTVKNPYLSSMIIFGIIMCFVYIIKKYGFLLVNMKINQKTIIAALIGIALFTFILMGSLTVLRYRLYRTSTFDFGIFAQMFYNMKNTFLPMTTCERSELLSHFSVHVSPIFYLILPIYYIFPYNETLIIVQLLFIISGVIPVYLICRHRKLSNLVTGAISAVYLLSPVLFGGLFYDFHENKFLTTLILWLVYFVEKENKIGVYIFSLLVLMVKEDAGIYVACIGLYILATKKAKEKISGAVIFIVSVIWFLAAYSWLNSGGDGAMVGRYSNFIGNTEAGVFDIINTIVKNPAYFFSQLLSAEKIENLLWVLVPVMFMPFKIRSIKELILLIPFLVINLMPSYAYQYNVSHQYYYGSFALMLYLVIVNMKEKRKYENIFVSICMLVASIIMFTSFVTDKFFYFDEYKVYQVRNEKIAEILAEVPEDASVSVTTYMMPNVSMRKEVYRYPAGENCDYIIFDLRKTQDAATYEEEADVLVNNGYEVINHLEGGVMVLKKK